MAGESERQDSARTLLIVGCGDLGARLAARLGAGWRVVGLRRNPSGLPPTIEGLAADYSRPGSLAGLESLQPDYVLTTLKPLGRGAEAYRQGFAGATANLLAGLGGHRPRAMLMVSSTRVYAERHGGWVREDSPLVRDDPAAASIIEAESALCSAGIPAAVLRCGGIYGDPDSRLLERISGGHICAPEPVRYGNRIHRDDVAGALQHLLQRVERGAQLAPVYLGVDGEAAPQHAVESWLATRLGLGVVADREPPATHKRCRGERLAASGYRLVYPDFRSGYEALLGDRADPP